MKNHWMDGVTVRELVAALSEMDPDMEVMGKVSGGLVGIRWAAEEEDDETGELVVMLGLDD